MNLLLGAGGEVSYNSLRARRGEIVGILPASKANEFVLRAWLQADPSEWEDWRAELVATHEGAEDESAAADALLSRFFEVSASLDAAQLEGLAEIVEEVAERAQPSQTDEPHPVFKAVEGALSTHDWTSDGDARQEREHLHAAVRSLRPLGDTTWQAVEGLLSNDLRTALEQARGPGVGTELEAVRGAELMSRHLGGGAIRHVLRGIPEFDPAAEPDEASAEISARSLLTAVAQETPVDTKKPPFGVSASRVLEVARSGGTDLDDAVAHWLVLKPKASELAPVAAALLPGIGAETKKALNTWSAGRTRPQRTTLAQHLLRERRGASGWLSEISTEPLNEAPLAELVKERVLNGPSVGDRARAAREAQALKFKTHGAGQTLAAAVNKLLKKSGRARGDIGVAALLVAAMPPGAVKKDAFGNTFKKRCDQKDYRLTEEEAKALRSRGVPVPKDGVAKRLLNKLGL